MSSGDLDVSALNTYGEASGEDAIAEMSDPEPEGSPKFEVQDMDLPKKARMRSHLELPPPAPDESGQPSPSVSKGRKGLNQKRFRKKSVNMALDDPSSLETALAVDLFEKHAGSALLMPSAELTKLLASLYQPSEVESNFLLMWFDLTGDGRVSFDEYTVVMASSIKAQGFSAEAGIVKARETLETQMERVMEEGIDGNRTLESDNDSRSGAVGKYLNQRPFGDEVIAQAKADCTEALLEPMKERFDMFDADKDGFLSPEELKNLVKVAYKPSSKRLAKMMRYFEGASDAGVSKSAFLIGMVNLGEDYAAFHLNASSK